MHTLALLYAVPVLLVGMFLGWHLKKLWLWIKNQ